MRFPAQATGTATLGEIEADCAVRRAQRGSGGAPSLAHIHPRLSPGAGARGLRVLRLRKPGEADRSALAANSSAVRPPSWACSVRPPRRRPPTRKLALRGRGGENARGGEPASPAAPRQWQTSRRPQGWLGRERYLTNKIKPNTPSQPELWRLRPPECRRRRPLPTSGGPTGKLLGRGAGRRTCGRAAGGGLEGSETPAGRPPPSALRARRTHPRLPQPLEGQQRVKSAPRHSEHGPLQPRRPPAARLGACPEPPRGPKPQMRHRSPAGV